MEEDFERAETRGAIENSARADFVLALLMQEGAELTLQQLRDFILAVEHGSLRRAALYGQQSQVSLTKSIKRLELSLGTELLIRNSRGITLTPTGARLLPRARLILSEVALVEAEASMKTQGRSVVSIGASPLAALVVTPPALQEFRGRYRDVIVRCSNGPYSKLLAELMAGTLDFIICPVFNSELDESLAVDVLSSHESVIVSGTSNPLRHATSLRQLVDAEWIVNGPLNWYSTNISLMFRQYGLDGPKVVMNCESFVDAIVHVKRSNLLSLCPPCLEALDVMEKVSIIKVRERPPTQTILLIRRKDRVLSKHAFTLYEIVKKVGTNQSPCTSK